jgi:hypothetical protein
LLPYPKLILESLVKPSSRPLEEWNCFDKRTLETIEEIVEKQKKSSYLSNRKLLNMKKYNHCYIFILYRSGAQDKKKL